MSSQVSRIEKKNVVNMPDDKRRFDRGRMEIANVGNATIGRFVLEPGWKWSTSVKPMVKTDSCEQMHTGYIISGRMRVRMNDGTEVECGRVGRWKRAMHRHRLYGRQDIRKILIDTPFFFLKLMFY